MITIMLIMMIVIIGAVLIAVLGSIIGCLPAIVLFALLLLADIILIRTLIRGIKNKKDK